MVYTLVGRLPLSWLFTRGADVFDDSSSTWAQKPLRAATDPPPNSAEILVMGLV